MLYIFKMQFWCFQELLKDISGISGVSRINNSEGMVLAFADHLGDTLLALIKSFYHMDRIITS